MGLIPRPRIPYYQMISFGYLHRYPVIFNIDIPHTTVSSTQATDPKTTSSPEPMKVDRRVQTRMVNYMNRPRGPIPDFEFFRVRNSSLHGKNYVQPKLVDNPIHHSTMFQQESVCFNIQDLLPTLKPFNAIWGNDYLKELGAEISKKL